MKAFYNDVDLKACAWLEELVLGGCVSDGIVDSRSIADVGPDDVRGYGRVHFFAGIGGWERALAKAGWPADRPVWTGSCPCQPFSCAGKGKGEADERHLWPEFFRLIAECRPAVVFGEQVASAAGRDWLDGVRGDLEGLGYAVGAADLCAPCAGEVGEGWFLRGDLSCGTFSREPMRVGPPHIRQRLYWVAWRRQESGVWSLESGGGSATGNRNGAGVGVQFAQGVGRGVVGGPGQGGEGAADQSGGCGDHGRVADGECSGEWWGRLCGSGEGACAVGEWAPDQFERYGAAGNGAGILPVPRGRILHTGHEGLEGFGGDGDRGGEPGWVGAVAVGSVAEAVCAGGGSATCDGNYPPAPPASGGSRAWSEYDILPFRDGKARRVERGTFPLAYGLPAGMVPGGDPSVEEVKNTGEARVMRLKGYGNAIVPEVAAIFVAAFLESEKELLKGEG